MRFVTLILCLVGALFSADAVVVKGFASKANGDMSLIVDSVDFRKDLVRVYGKLIGKPHTSNRIEEISVCSGNQLKKLNATDIEGIDFKRWFQWEDDGAISLEIDFPAFNSRGLLEFRVKSAKGDCVWNVSKIKSNKRGSR